MKLKGRNRFNSVIIGIAAFFILFLIVGGWLYYGKLSDDIGENAGLYLASLASERAAGIENWLRENEKKAASVEPFVEKRKTPKSNSVNNSAVEEWLLINAGAFEAESAALYDGNGKLLIKGKNAQLNIPDELTIEEVNPKNKISFGELFFIKDRFYIDAVIPLYKEENRDTPSGYLALNIMLNDNLFGRMKQTAGEYKSEELLLIPAKKGNYTILIDLRTKKVIVPDLSEREKGESIFQQFNRDKEITDGIDQKGVEVKACNSEIKGLNWSVISKADKSEIEEPLKAERTKIILFVSIVTLMFAVTIYFLIKPKKIIRKENKEGIKTDPLIAESSEQRRGSGINSEKEIVEPSPEVKPITEEAPAAKEEAGTNRFVESEEPLEIKEPESDLKDVEPEIEVPEEYKNALLHVEPKVITEVTDAEPKAKESVNAEARKEEPEEGKNEESTVIKEEIHVEIITESGTPVDAEIETSIEAREEIENKPDPNEEVASNEAEPADEVIDTKDISELSVDKEEKQKEEIAQAETKEVMIAEGEESAREVVEEPEVTIETMEIEAAIKVSEDKKEVTESNEAETGTSGEEIIPEMTEESRIIIPETMPEQSAENLGTQDENAVSVKEESASALSEEECVEGKETDEAAVAAEIRKDEIIAPEITGPHDEETVSPMESATESFTKQTETVLDIPDDSASKTEFQEEEYPEMEMVEGSLGDSSGELTGAEYKNPDKEILTKLDQVKTFALIPKILFEINMLINKEPDNVAKLSNIIIKEQSLTTKLLSVANSPYYGLKKKIASVEYALLLLGREEVCRLVTALSLSDMVRFPSTPTIRYLDYWYHSMIVGFTSRDIAQKLGFGKVVNEVFLAGIFHDLGVQIIAKHFPDRFASIMERINEGESAIEAETALLNCTHQEIGRYAAQKWGLPEDIYDGLGYHHNPALAGKGKVITGIINMADWMTHQVTSEESLWDKGIDLEVSNYRILGFKTVELRNGFLEQYYPTLMAIIQSIQF